MREGERVEKHTDLLDSVCRETVLHRGDEPPLEGAELAALVKHIGQARRLRTQGKNQLLVAATDLNVSLTAELKSQNASEGGITLGAKNLYEPIANTPGEEVSVSSTSAATAGTNGQPRGFMSAPRRTWPRG